MIFRGCADMHCMVAEGDPAVVRCEPHSRAGKYVAPRSAEGVRLKSDTRVPPGRVPAMSAGGRLRRPGGQAASAAALPGGGGTWGTRGFPTLGFRHVERAARGPPSRLTPGGRSDQWPMATFV